MEKKEKAQSATYGMADFPLDWNRQDGAGRTGHAAF